jgi:hypothetical protein
MEEAPTLLFSLIRGAPKPCKLLRAIHVFMQLIGVTVRFELPKYAQKFSLHQKPQS